MKVVYYPALQDPARLARLARRAAWYLEPLGTQLNPVDFFVSGMEVPTRLVDLPPLSEDLAITPGVANFSNARLRPASELEAALAEADAVFVHSEEALPVLDKALARLPERPRVVCVDHHRECSADSFYRRFVEVIPKLREETRAFAATALYLRSDLEVAALATELVLNVQDQKAAEQTHTTPSRRQQYKAQIEQLSATLETYWQDAEAARMEISQLRTELDRVYASRSWRLTAPIRGLRRMLGT